MQGYLPAPTQQAGLQEASPCENFIPPTAPYEDFPQATLPEAAPLYEGKWYLPWPPGASPCEEELSELLLHASCLICGHLNLCTYYKNDKTSSVTSVTQPSTSTEQLCTCHFSLRDVGGDVGGDMAAGFFGMLILVFAGYMFKKCKYHIMYGGKFLWDKISMISPKKKKRCVNHKFPSFFPKPQRKLNV